MENAETDCRAVLARLYLYLDGEIAGPDCAAIDEHLRRCRDCFDHFGFERHFKEILARKCGEEILPEGLVERLRARLREIL